VARWSLEDISIATPLPLNGSTYGHEFSAVFRLRYTVGRSISNVFSRNPVALQKESQGSSGTSPSP
jgi:hypothetical protein